MEMIKTGYVLMSMLEHLLEVGEAHNTTIQSSMSFFQFFILIFSYAMTISLIKHSSFNSGKVTGGWIL